MIATTGLRERPLDPETGGPVPFVCEQNGIASMRLLVKKQVIRCALSRICGVCGDSLGRPVTFIGSRSEADRLAFHFPPVHLACGEAVLESIRDVSFGVLGHDSPVGEWVVMTTGGFEFERPQPHALDPRPTFRPNSVIGEQLAG